MRPVRIAATLGLALAPALASVALGPVPASADVTSVPGLVSTAAVNTAGIVVPVPTGVVPRAITGVLTMPEVVNNGVVTFRVNGRPARIVDSTLYRRVRIPVTAADVVADGTIALTMTSQGPAIGTICRPAAGEATLRKVALDYSGSEQPPTTIEDFFPPAASRIDVLIPPDADAQLLEAGLTAVAALTARYGAETPVELDNLDQIPTSGTASQRIVVLTAGSSDETTNQVTAGPSTGGVPTLTIAGTGPALTEAARELGTVGSPLAAETADQAGPRTPQLDRTLADFAVGEVVLSGYGTTTRRVRLLQDVFATPVGSMELRLQGMATAVSAGEQARIDVRLGEDLVGSTPLDDSGRWDLTVVVPEQHLGPAVDLDIVLSATTAEGNACAAPGVPPIEVRVDAPASRVTATPLETDQADFSHFPQVLRGVLPVAIRPATGDPLDGAVEAARLIAALQRVAAAPFDVQLVRPETLVADGRSGLLVGASAADAVELGAPALLTAIRPSRTGSTLQVTSQVPYAVLQTVAQDDRSVLMLGSWAPGDNPAPLTVIRTVVAYATNPGWDSLRGDLVLADTDTPPVASESDDVSVATEPEESDDNDSFPMLWLVVVGGLLAQVALFVLLLRRRDRRTADAPGSGVRSEELLGSRTSTRAYLEDFEFREQHLPTDEPVPAEPKKPVAKPSVARTSVTKKSPNTKKRR